MGHTTRARKINRSAKSAEVSLGIEQIPQVPEYVGFCPEKCFVQDSMLLADTSEEAWLEENEISDEGEDFSEEKYDLEEDQMLSEDAIPFDEDVSIAAAPTIVRQFSGVGFSGWIPPDTMGAVGTGHIVNVVNGLLTVNNKTTGAVLASTTLNGFWSATGVLTGIYAFDPKVLYDKLSNRFFIVSFAGTSSPNSWLLVGVSQPGNPLIWRVHAIDADRFGTTQTNTWADYPGIGLDNTHVYITANMFSNAGFFQNVKVWVLQKSALYGVLASWYEFLNPPGSEFTTQPTQVFNAGVTVQYLVGLSSLNTIRLSRISFSGGVPIWTSLRNFNITPLSGFINPDARQRGSAQLIDSGDTRLLQAIFQNGRIWTTHAVPNAAGTRTEVAWYQLNPASSVPVQQGRIRSNTRFYYYPSLAVNNANNMVIGFSGSSPTEYASGFFTGRLATDPLGTTQPVRLLRTGLGPYYIPDGGGRNRWGDYSATVVDPSNDMQFWTVQEYATANNRWATWWGAIRFI